MIAQTWVWLGVIGLAGSVFAVVATSIWLMRFTRVPGLGGGLLLSAIASGTVFWIFSRGFGA